jgi:hypothetical protein
LLKAGCSKRSLLSTSLIAASASAAGSAIRVSGPRMSAAARYSCRVEPSAAEQSLHTERHAIIVSTHRWQLLLVVDVFGVTSNGGCSCHHALVCSLTWLPLLTLLLPTKWPLCCLSPDEQ